MTDSDKSQSGPQSGASFAALLDGLSSRSRVHEVAKRFGITPRLLVVTLAEQGMAVKSSSSSVDVGAARAALSTLFERGQLTAVPGPTVEAPTAAAAAAPEPAPEAPTVAEEADAPEPVAEEALETAAVPDPPAPAAARRRRRVAQVPPAATLEFLAPDYTAPPAEPVAAEQPVSLFADLPARSRVHELAKRAGISAKAMIAALTERGIEVKSANSVIAKGVAEDVLTALLAPAVEVAAPEPELSGPGAVETDAEATPEGQDDDRGRRRRRGRRGRGRPNDRAQDTDELSAAEGPEDASAEVVAEAGATDNLGLPTTDATEKADTDVGDSDDDDQDDSDDQSGEAADGGPSRSGRRRRRRGGRGPERPAVTGSVADNEPADPSGPENNENPAAEQDDEDTDPTASAGSEGADGADGAGEEWAAGTSRRRRRRRRGTSDENGKVDDPADTVVHVREARSAAAAASEVQGVRGSTRLEAKRQRRRDSLQTRRRPQILTEAEFLARRESVHRVMAVRQRGDLTQVAVLEDGVLVEHFVSRAGSASMIGNVYLGRVQNVLPSMEAAFVDIGRGRNAVLYAGEVNWEAAGLAGKSRKIETALKSGDTVLVQISKDPVGHKGARLTTQLSLPGRFLVYVPAGGATGISRKLPDTERRRLKSILDRIVPDDAGVIIRTAAEGVSEEELARDVERLQAQWKQISDQATKLSGSGATKQLYSEPDTLIKVIRDLFNSDISELIIDGDEVWESLSAYVEQVAPELAERAHRYDGYTDVFAAYRIDEQIAKALERKVYLPSGGSLVIDRTEAMTVIDVNTGKYTGSGGNLEETVTKNNLEAAEEVVRQLRLRDIGGIIVVDFIDMVLESNRELVLRRLTECLGRDRTRHQVAEVTSLGLIQMTRKKMGTGLVEAFSEPCEHCHGRGIVLRDVPVDPQIAEAFDAGSDRSGRSRGRGRDAVEAEPIVTAPPRVAPPRPDPRGPKPPELGVSAILGGSDSAAGNGLSHELLAELNGRPEFEDAESDVADEAALNTMLLAQPGVSDDLDPGDTETPAGRRRRRGGRGKSRREQGDSGNQRGLEPDQSENAADGSGFAGQDPELIDGAPIDDEMGDTDLFESDVEGADLTDSVSKDTEAVEAYDTETVGADDPEPASEPPFESAPESALPAGEQGDQLFETPPAVPARPRRRRSASRPAGPPQVVVVP